ncbi:MAG: hypothetical protein U9O94_03340 [Nanoarchaeota archaeon]|nr:hypothetical protein [Nanoarchaeota archaeon]
MISIEAQQKLFVSISRRLKRPITIYAVGGTAMMFLGFKDATIDIDLVFENDKDKKIFKDATKKIGYREMDPFKIYGARTNQPEMLTLGDERFDLFVVNVIDFIFSEQMKERADKTHQFNNNLILKIADPHDIILMKCATERAKDADDARKIIENTEIKWNLIVGEVKNQINLGKSQAAFELGEFLEKLKYKMKLDIPKKTLDNIFNIVEKQAEEKQK